MAFENLKSTGIAYLLGKIKTFLSDTYVKIADSVRSVNDVTPDANGNIKIDTVQYAQNLESESSQRNVETFIQRTTGGSAPVENGDGWLMLLKGNSVHENYVAESIVMTVTPVERSSDDEEEEPDEPITATIDRDTFVAYVDESGTTNLVYSTQWSADPALYGITVIGTPVAGDMISVVYVKEERGTITVAEPSKFVSTGWNLYDNSVGYAKVVKYEYGYMIDGTYTSLKYASTPTGTQFDITVTDGMFNIPDDGYIIVTGGNGTDTAIFPYWTDWTDGYDGSFSVYHKDEIDLSGLFGEGNFFPYGLLKVSDIADEIDLNIGQATSRVDRMDYSDENLATAKASGLAYEYDEDYIYIARSTVLTSAISIDGSVACDDHGIEYFEGTEVPVYTELLYGNNLKNKLEMNVLTISQQTLTSAQKEQVCKNLGVGTLRDVPISIAVTDWAAVTGGFKATYNTTYATSTCKWEMLWDSSIKTYASRDIIADIKSGAGGFEFVTAIKPTGTISGIARIIDNSDGRLSVVPQETVQSIANGGTGQSSLAGIKSAFGIDAIYNQLSAYVVIDNSGDANAKFTQAFTEINNSGIFERFKSHPVMLFLMGASFNGSFTGTFNMTDGGIRFWVSDETRSYQGLFIRSNNTLSSLTSLSEQIVAQSITTGITGVSAVKQGKLVILSIGISTAISTTSAAWVDIGTLPSSLTPASTRYANLIDYNASNRQNSNLEGRVINTGKLSVYLFANESAKPYGQFCYFVE